MTQAPIGIRRSGAQLCSFAVHFACNLLAPDESYATFLHRHVRPARYTLHQHGVKGFHELLAAYACERYTLLTGHAPSVSGGTLHRADPARDREARQQIAIELGHHRLDVVSAYIGGRR